MCDIMLRCTRADLLIWEIKYSWLIHVPRKKRAGRKRGKEKGEGWQK